MEYVKLGNSDLRVSRICLGCMGFGDPTIGQHSWTIGEEPVWVAASKNKKKKHQKELYRSFHSFVMAAELSPCDKHSDLGLRHLPLRR